jgi:hypothetical protein
MGVDALMKAYLLVEGDGTSLAGYALNMGVALTEEAAKRWVLNKTDPWKYRTYQIMEVIE